ncbi:hypothetical protein DFH09DRAFT_1081215 [Mycena vulgaris]|nr:hypothetical protein DFH09DRAFT_1081215 [Mycena vulgaris]
MYQPSGWGPEPGSSDSMIGRRETAIYGMLSKGGGVASKIRGMPEEAWRNGEGNILYKKPPPPLTRRTTKDTANEGAQEGEDRRVQQIFEVAVEMEVQTWSSRLTKEQAATEAVTEAVLRAAAPFFCQPLEEFYQAPDRATSLLEIHCPNESSFFNVSEEGTGGSLTIEATLSTPKQPVSDPLDTTNFEVLVLTDQVRFPRPTQSEIQEFNEHRCTSITTGVSVVLTSVGSGPSADRPRAITLGKPWPPLQVRQTIFAHGTLRGRWTLTACKFIRDRYAFIEWVDYEGKRKVLVQTPMEDVDSRGLMRQRTKSLVRSISMRLLKTSVN